MADFYQGCKGEISPFEIGQFNFSSGYIIEEKYDGHWCEFEFNADGKLTCISRQNKEKVNEQLQSLFEYMEKTFKLKNTSLVGELAFGTEAGTRHAESVGHHSVDIFDVVVHNGKNLTVQEDGTCIPLLERKKILRGIFNKCKPDKEWVKESEFILVESATTVQDRFNEVMALNGEGLIAKDINDAYYRRGSKSPYWFKIKKFVTGDYVVMDYVPTKSADFKKKGWIGSIRCGLYVKGKLVKKVDVGGMTFEMRKMFSENKKAMLGRVVEIGGNEITAKGSVRHPWLMCLRDEDDKVATDCTWEV